MIKSKFKVLAFILFSILTVIFISCKNAEENAELKILDAEAKQSMSSYHKKGLDSLATLLLRKSRLAKNKKYECKAHLYLSYFTPGMPKKTVANKLCHLEIAERIAEETHNDTLLTYIYNQRGAYELSINYNITTSQYWFNRSIAKASTLKDREFSIPAEMNMSEACRMNSDTIGIRYDNNLFDYATKTDNTLLKFLAGMHCAVYYAVSAKDTTELRPYIDAMRPLQKEYPGTIEMIFAIFYLNKGKYSEAEHFISHSQPENYTDFQILYAEILNKLGRYKESDSWTEKVIPNRKLINFNDFGKMLRIRVDNMSATGNQKEAFLRLKEYEDFRDSVNRLKNIDLTKRYKVEFEVALKDREISEQKLHIRNMTIIIIAIVFFVVSAALGYFFWNRRRKRFYHDIVKQNREFIKMQEIMSERIARRESKIHELESALSGSAIKQSKISDEKAEEIFDRIQHLADEKQVWKDTNITRDAFADMVGCNRTYFSEVLKAKTGMNYSQFMNSCRIREAMKVLSNPEDTTSLKELSARLGFLTIQTFYSAFKNHIGMSPAVYRKAAIDSDRMEPPSSGQSTEDLQ